MSDNANFNMGYVVTNPSQAVDYLTHGLNQIGIQIRI